MAMDGSATQIWDDLSPSLRSYLRSKGVSRSDEDDIIQEVRLRLLRVPPDKKIRSPIAYMIRYAQNVQKEWWRKKQRNPVVTDSELAQESSDYPHPGFSQRNDPAITIAAQDELRHRFRKLPPKLRKIVLMRKLEDLSISEIATTLGYAEDTIEKYLKAAVTIFRHT